MAQLYPNWVGELHTFKLENVACAIQLLSRSLVSPLSICLEAARKPLHNDSTYLMLSFSICLQAKLINNSELLHLLVLPV